MASLWARPIYEHWRAYAQADSRCVRGGSSIGGEIRKETRMNSYELRLMFFMGFSIGFGAAMLLWAAS